MSRIRVKFWSAEYQPFIARCWSEPLTRAQLLVWRTEGQGKKHETQESAEESQERRIEDLTPGVRRTRNRTNNSSWGSKRSWSFRQVVSSFFMQPSHQWTEHMPWFTHYCARSNKSYPFGSEMDHFSHDVRYCTGKLNPTECVLLELNWQRQLMYCTNYIKHKQQNTYYFLF